MFFSFLHLQEIAGCFEYLPSSTQEPDELDEFFLLNDFKSCAELPKAESRYYWIAIITSTSARVGKEKGRVQKKYRLRVQLSLCVVATQKGIIRFNTLSFLIGWQNFLI